LKGVGEMQEEQHGQEDSNDREPSIDACKETALIVK
jgi:hypothetical protein